jgi:hypothetical protein
MTLTVKKEDHGILLLEKRNNPEYCETHPIRKCAPERGQGAHGKSQVDLPTTYVQTNPTQYPHLWGFSMGPLPRPLRIMHTPAMIPEMSGTNCVVLVSETLDNNIQSSHTVHIFYIWPRKRH